MRASLPTLTLLLPNRMAQTSLPASISSNFQSGVHQQCCVPLLALKCSFNQPPLKLLASLSALGCAEEFIQASLPASTASAVSRSRERFVSATAMLCFRLEPRISSQPIRLDEAAEERR
jgi:hypothetical protein